MPEHKKSKHRNSNKNSKKSKHYDCECVSDSDSDKVHRVNKRKNNRHTQVISKTEKKCEILPHDFCNYMKAINTRFDDICETYLQGLTIDDIKYLEPEDYINLVPQDKYKDKLLMTIMVRRYIYDDE